MAMYKITIKEMAEAPRTPGKVIWQTISEIGSDSYEGSISEWDATVRNALLRRNRTPISITLSDTKTKQIYATFQIR